MNFLFKYVIFFIINSFTPLKIHYFVFTVKLHLYLEWNSTNESHNFFMKCLSIDASEHFDIYLILNYFLKNAICKYFNKIVILIRFIFSSANAFALIYVKCISVNSFFNKYLWCNITLINLFSLCYTMV